MTQPVSKPIFGLLDLGLVSSSRLRIGDEGRGMGLVRPRRATGWSGAR